MGTTDCCHHNRIYRNRTTIAELDLVLVTYCEIALNSTNRIAGCISYLEVVPDKLSHWQELSSYSDKSTTRGDFGDKGAVLSIVDPPGVLEERKVIIQNDEIISSLAIC